MLTQPRGWENLFPILGMPGSFTRDRREPTNPSVTVEVARDEVVYNFEVPGALLENGQKLPRTDPREAVFNARRAPSRRARATFPP